MAVEIRGITEDQRIATNAPQMLAGFVVGGFDGIEERFERRRREALGTAASDVLVAKKADGSEEECSSHSQRTEQEVVHQNESPCARMHRGFHRGAGDGLLSRGLSTGVPSALSGLTTVFGMGTGVAPTIESPAKHENGTVDRRFSPSRPDSKWRALPGQDSWERLSYSPFAKGSSQAARAIRTSSLGAHCGASTAGLLTSSSLT